MSAPSSSPKREVRSDSGVRRASDAQLIRFWTEPGEDRPRVRALARELASGVERYFAGPDALCEHLRRIVELLEAEAASSAKR